MAVLLNMLSSMPIERWGGEDKEKAILLELLTVLQANSGVPNTHTHTLYQRVVTAQSLLLR